MGPCTTDGIADRQVVPLQNLHAIRMNFHVAPANQESDLRMCVQLFFEGNFRGFPSLLFRNAIELVGNRAESGEEGAQAKEKVFDILGTFIVGHACQEKPTLSYFVKDSLWNTRA